MNRKLGNAGPDWEGLARSREAALKQLTEQELWPCRRERDSLTLERNRYRVALEAIIAENRNTDGRCDDCVSTPHQSWCPIGIAEGVLHA